MALQYAGLLGVLIFVISSIFEVLSINHLYVSQQGLIAVLLEVLAGWALFEVTLIHPSERSQPLRSLRLLLGLQIGLITARHWNHFVFQHRSDSYPLPPPTASELSQGLLCLLINLLLFLAISRCLIAAFAAAERLRANQLQEQNRALRQIQEELKASQERQQQLEQQQRTQLEQKLKTSLSAAAVVHEIQQPLSAILLNCRSTCDWLKGRPAGSLSEPLRASLHQISSDAERVVLTMERMRMLLRNVETEPSAIDLCDTVSSGLLFLKHDLAEAQVQPLLEGLGQPCPLSGDGAQLQIAVVNLIRNALQAMQAQPLASGWSCMWPKAGQASPRAIATTPAGSCSRAARPTGWASACSSPRPLPTNHCGQLRIGRSLELGGADVVIELPIAKATDQ